MKLVLTQPNFIPWRGMFEQIKACDQLVIYDTVQLPKGGGKGRGFSTRVQIKTKQGQKWLSVPVSRSTGGCTQLIKDARFPDNRWRKSHLGAIDQAYRQAPFFEEIWNRVVLPIYDFDTDELSQFNVNAICHILKYLGIERSLVLSSRLELERRETASERVLEICQLFKANEYITAQGAANYLDHQLFELAGVKVVYMDYILAPYPQLHGDFLPYVSILDLLFNVGEDSADQLTPRFVSWKD
jgi:hypothetical protein